MSFAKRPLHVGQRGSMSIFKRFHDDCSGATAVEYGLIAALISVSMIAGLGAFSDALNNVFGIVSNSIKNAGTNL